MEKISVPFRPGYFQLEGCYFLAETPYVICIEIDGIPHPFAKSKIEYDSSIKYRVGVIIKELIVPYWVLESKGLHE